MLVPLAVSNGTGCFRTLILQPLMLRDCDGHHSHRSPNYLFLGVSTNPAFVVPEDGCKNRC
jgi:hypothetical protein